MKSAFRLLPVALVATFAVAGAQAQSTNSYPSQSGERASMLPYTHNGYTGISAGRSKYDLSTGPVGMAYDNSDTAFTKQAIPAYLPEDWYTTYTPKSEDSFEVRPGQRMAIVTTLMCKCRCG